MAARALIRGLIAKGAVSSELSTLSQFESRIDAINDDNRRQLDAETKRLLAALDSGNEKAVDEELERVDELRDDLIRKLERSGPTCWLCWQGFLHDCGKAASGQAHCRRRDRARRRAGLDVRDVGLGGITCRSAGCWRAREPSRRAISTKRSPSPRAMRSAF